MADYNGWKNWETWQINLWLDNEEPLCRDKQRFLRSPRLTEESVRAYCEEVFPDGTPDMQGDEKETVAEQMAKVDWTEIYESFASEAEEMSR